GFDLAQRPLDGGRADKTLKIEHPRNSEIGTALPDQGMPFGRAWLIKRKTVQVQNVTHGILLPKLRSRYLRPASRFSQDKQKLASLRKFGAWVASTWLPPSTIVAASARSWGVHHWIETVETGAQGGAQADFRGFDRRWNARPERRLFCRRDPRYRAQRS